MASLRQWKTNTADKRLVSSRRVTYVYLQMPACPLMASSRSCRMLCNVERATMVFSRRTAIVLIAARTAASPLPVRVPPAAQVRSHLRSSSQHSNSCTTTSPPVNFVPSQYSFQLVTKYAHSSPVPASNTDGRFSLYARALVDGVIAVAVCAAAWMFRIERAVWEWAFNLYHTAGLPIF